MTLTAALQARAIISAHSSNHSVPIADMHEAAALGSSTAAYNIRVLEHTPVSRSTLPTHPRGPQQDYRRNGRATRIVESLSGCRSLSCPSPTATMQGTAHRSRRALPGQVSLWRNASWNLLAIQMKRHSPPAAPDHGRIRGPHCAMG